MADDCDAHSSLIETLRTTIQTKDAEIAELKAQLSQLQAIAKPPTPKNFTLHKSPGGDRPLKIPHGLRVAAEPVTASKHVTLSPPKPARSPVNRQKTAPATVITNTAAKITAKLDTKSPKSSENTLTKAAAPPAVPTPPKAAAPKASPIKRLPHTKSTPALFHTRSPHTSHKAAARVGLTAPTKAALDVAKPPLMYGAQAMMEAISTTAADGPQTNTKAFAMSKYNEALARIKAALGSHLQSFDALQKLDREMAGKADAAGAASKGPSPDTAAKDSVTFPPMRGPIFPPTDAKYLLEAGATASEEEEEDGEGATASGPKHSMALRHVSGCDSKMFLLLSDAPSSPTGSQYDILYASGAVPVICDATEESSAVRFRTTAGEGRRGEAGRGEERRGEGSGVAEIINPLFITDQTDSNTTQNNTTKPRLQRFYTGHQGQVMALARHPFLPVAASIEYPRYCDDDDVRACVHLWDSRNMSAVNSVWTFPEQLGIVVSQLDFSSCGRYLITLSTTDGGASSEEIKQYLAVWDVTTFSSDLDTTTHHVSAAINTSAMQPTPVAVLDLQEAMGDAGGDLVSDMVICQDVQTKPHMQTSWHAATVLLRTNKCVVAVTVRATVTGEDAAELKIIEATLGTTSALYVKRSHTRPAGLQFSTSIIKPEESVMPSSTTILNADAATIRIRCATGWVEAGSGFSSVIILIGDQNGKLHQYRDGTYERSIQLTDGSTVVAITRCTLTTANAKLVAVQSNGLVTILDAADAEKRRNSFQMPSSFSGKDISAMSPVYSRGILHVFLCVSRSILRLMCVDVESNDPFHVFSVLSASSGKQPKLACHPTMPMHVTLGSRGEICVVNHESRRLALLGSLMPNTDVTGREYTSVDFSCDGKYMIACFTVWQPLSGTENASDVFCEVFAVHVEAAGGSLSKVSEDATPRAAAGTGASVLNVLDDSQINLIAVSSFLIPHKQSSATVVKFSPSAASDRSKHKLAAAREGGLESYKFAVGFSNGTLDLLSLVLDTGSTWVIRRLKSMKPMVGHCLPQPDGSFKLPAVLTIDWDSTGRYIQSSLASYELAFWDAEAGTAVRHPSMLRDVTWSTYTALFGWPVVGTWDAPSINVAKRRKDWIRPFANNLLCCKNRTGNDVFLVAKSSMLAMYSYPASQPTCMPAQYSCSNDASAMQFSGNDAFIVVLDSRGSSFLWRFQWSDDLLEKTNLALADDDKCTPTAPLTLPKSTGAMYVNHAHSLRLVPSFITLPTPKPAAPSDMNVLSQIRASTTGGSIGDPSAQQEGSIGPMDDADVIGLVPTFEPETRQNLTSRSGSDFEPPIRRVYSNPALIKQMSVAGFGRPRGSFLKKPREMPKRKPTASLSHSSSLHDASSGSEDEAEKASVLSAMNILGEDEA